MKDTTSNTRKFKDGDIVFVNSPWHTAEKCKVTGFAKDSRINQPVYTVHSIDCYCYGTFCATEDCMFNTKEDAISAYETEYENEVKSYCEQIKTLKDLVKFPIDNCLCSEDTDYPALEAYKIKAKEMVTVISSSLLQLISEYADKHELATECGSEYIYQDDEAQEDAIKLVADIFDDYCNTPLRISHEELFDE